MQLDDVIRRIPMLDVNAVCIALLPEPDDTPRICWINASVCQMFGAAEDQILGLRPSELLHWDYAADFLEAVHEMEAAGRRSLSCDTLCLRPDGSAFWGGVSVFHITGEAGEDGCVVVSVRDIDDLKNREQSAELALIEHEHLLKQVEAVQTRLVNALDMTPGPFAIFDARDRLVTWNTAYAESLTDDPAVFSKGMKKQDVLQLALDRGYIDDAIGQEEAWLDSFMAAFREAGRTVSQIRLRGRDYRVIRSQAPNGDRIVLKMDISEFLRQRQELQGYADRLEEANREISHQAMNDELTGLGNRRYLKAMLDRMVAERRRAGDEIAALHVDLDRFKQINDTMGHGAGDHVLVTVADILRRNVRESDIVARIGGDEFIVLMRCTADSDAPEILAERLVAEVSEPVPFEDRLCRLGASVGIARTPIIQPEELMTCSDVALYKAKEGGRQLVASFDLADLESLRNAKEIADDIHRGLENGEFVPFYQPQIATATGEVVALEVLVRWQHPHRGLLAPGAFLDIAADVHVDGEIDRAVFRRATEECRDRYADAENPPSLSFNVGHARLMDDQLLVELDRMAYSGTATFELVETVFLEEQSEAFLTRIAALRARGVSFEVDGFGSGRASIVGLRRLAPDRLKIDRRLIEPIVESRSGRKLVKSIVDIGLALDIGVTAAGVETTEQAVTLRALGCDRLQGFLFSPPVPLADLPPTATALPAANVAGGG